MGEPILRAVAAPVEDARAPEIRKLAADMAETMAAAEGLGIAAPQVRSGLRLIVFLDRFDPGDDEEAPSPVVLINPTFEPLDDEKPDAYEGCLSIPGLRGPVPRFRRIRYRGLDLEGRAVERLAEGLHARVVQHEIDHLDGVLFPERMTDVGALAFEDVLERRRRAEEEA